MDRASAVLLLNELKADPGVKASQRANIIGLQNDQFQ